MVVASDLTFYRYSPENMDEAVLRKLFVGREGQLESIFSEIETFARKNSPRFYLIVGPRGIGKSHFLSLLYYDIKSKLDSLLIPVKLAEEEYSIFRASDLFLRILEETKVDVSDILSLEKEDDILYAAIEKLKQVSKQENKRYIIFAENLHELFKQLEKEEVQKLRSIFQKHDIFSVVATAPMIFPGVSEHDEPFYNFFRIQHLNELSLNEIKTLIKKIAETEGNKDFLDEFEKYEEKIHGMEHLTGGSPRLVILFYEMITRGELENVEKAFLKIVDEHTPYYQEIFQLLSGQRRKIFDIVISAGKPVTPKEISKVARISIQTVTTQLRRLEGDGYVRSRPEGRHTKYEVRERLFRLWREMRQPLGRKRITVLLEFLQYWYTPDERNELFTAKFKLLEAGGKTGLKELCYYAEALPTEFKTGALLKLTPKLLELNQQEEAKCEIQKLKEILAETKDKKLEEKIPLYETLYEGKQLIFERKYEEALEAFNKALEINQSDEYALSSKGDAFGYLGRYEEALETFNQVLEINPKHDFALSRKGYALLLLGKHEEALALFNSVLEINPKHEFALSRKGAVLLDMGKHDEALSVFNSVLEINPKHEFALSRKGYALLLLGKHEEALALFNSVLEINPKHEYALSSKDVALGNLGKHDEALSVFNSVLEINPKDEYVLSGKGAALLNLGKNDEALSVFNSVLEINPKHEYALSRKGTALLYLGKHDEALSVFNSVLEINPKNEYALSNKGFALGNLGRHEEALETFNQVLGINPKNEYALENLFVVNLNLALKELKVNNLGNASKLIKTAHEYSSKLKDEDANALTIDFLKEAAESGMPVVKAAVHEILKLNGDKYGDKIKPITKAIEIVETEDMQKYYDLQVEEREIVADIVRKITKSDDLIPEEIKRKERS